jgi:primosomal protein N' (replication factor Y)
MVPEISLTPQMKNYLANVFNPKSIAVYSSKLNKTEQQNIWKGVYSGRIRLVIGSRSSLFLPYRYLKTIIVDEEHDGSYKQDMDPKYQVRYIVQWMSFKLGIGVILGSATPSVESYKAAEDGKINYIELKNRAKASKDLSYEIIDMKDEKKRGNWHYLSDRLVELINDSLNKNEQILLLHNRRGSSNFLQCEDCGKVEECINCSISLTPHGHELVCHYCDYKKAAPNECGFCGNVDIKHIGVGVKGLEVELKKYFPESRVVRVDSDTNSKKNAHIENYEAISSGEADIVVGTQAIATGLDIENVGLVAVINVDQHLNFPDFRANERSFQLLTQFAGRAGRGKIEGNVLFQVHQEDSIVLKSIVTESYRDYVTSEMEFRRMFGYPPYSRMTRLIFSDKNRGKVDIEVGKVVQTLDKVSYPRYKSSVPLVERKHGKYYHQIILFDLNPKKIIDYLDLGKGWSIDRDPISMF